LPFLCPVWSPRGDLIAFTARDERNVFDIFTVDSKTKEIRRLTQDQGNNEEPSFSPNGRVIAFAARRRGQSGIYLANADGTGPQVRVYDGWATEVDWGPAPR